MFLGLEPPVDAPDLLEARPLGRPGVVAAEDEKTRVAGEDPAPAPPFRRSRWPTVVGAMIGLLGSVLLLPIWPPPLDQVARRAVEWVHPSARPRLPGALPDVIAEDVQAFPYVLGERTVVVVRGEAKNRGAEPVAGAVAVVLMLDGDTERSRASAVVGPVPSPRALAARLDDPAPAGEASAIEPGARVPFLAFFPDPRPEEARAARYRVEFLPLGDASASRPEAPPPPARPVAPRRARRAEPSAQR